MHECHYIFRVNPLLNSCYHRWHNHLNPDIRKDAWTPEEERALINAHRVYGNKWAELAKVLPGRYFHTAIPFSVPQFAPNHFAHLIKPTNGVEMTLLLLHVVLTIVWIHVSHFLNLKNAELSNMLDSYFGVYSVLY
jgi:hypothetical protein